MDVLQEFDQLLTDDQDVQTSGKFDIKWLIGHKNLSLLNPNSIWIEAIAISN